MPIQPGEVTVNGEPATIKLPDGCVGLMFVFDSEAAAREWYGEDVGLKEIEVYSSTHP